MIISGGFRSGTGSAVGFCSSGKLKISPELTFDFTAEDLEDCGEIGRGAYGTVNKMLHSISSTTIAVKVNFQAFIIFLVFYGMSVGVSVMWLSISIIRKSCI